MKSFIKISVLAVMIVCCSLSSVAEDSKSEPKETMAKTILLTLKPSSHRPNAPSRTFIECQYCNEGMLFTFPEGIYSISVTITNGADAWYGHASRETNEIHFPPKSGDYEMECVTDDGRVFYGQLLFD